MYDTDSSTKEEVIIEPYCIFCGGQTDNVERYTLVKVETEKTSIWDTSEYEYTSTNTLTVPFPAHHHCFEKKTKTWLDSYGYKTAVILFIFFFALLAVSADPVMYIGLIAALFVGALTYLANKKLEKQIQDYYDTHVQRE